MTGGASGVQAVITEAVWRQERRQPQPGDRPPAPGPLAVVQAFINTHFDLVEDWGAEQLCTPDALARWLASRGLLDQSERRLGRGDLRRAIEFREALRAMLQAGDPPGPEWVDRLNRAVGAAKLEVRFTPGGPELKPAAGSGLDGAIAGLLAVIVTAVGDGSWWRLKACPGEHCGWVFFDASRNNSGRWCSMAVCGGRAKARSHYRRQRAQKV